MSALCVNELQKNINFMERYNYIDRTKYDTKIKVAKAQKNESKLKDVYNTIFYKVLKGAKVNFVISNLPEFGIDNKTGNKIEVSSKIIHNTMSEFGHVSDVIIYRNNAYVWFDSLEDAKNVHNLINNMQIGDNIVKTQLIR
jgi:hypothetical protein